MTPDIILIPAGATVRLGRAGYVASEDTALPSTLAPILEKQTTRMHKVQCQTCTVHGRPYSLRMSRATMAAGLPFCGICAEPMIPATE